MAFPARSAVLSAIARDDTDHSRLTLRSSVFVDGNYASTGMLLRQAVGLQALQALRTARLVAPLVHGEPDVGPHPKSGLRSEPAASLGYLEAVFTFHGKRPSAFEGDDLLREGSPSRPSTRTSSTGLGSACTSASTWPFAPTGWPRGDLPRRLEPHPGPVLPRPSGTAGSAVLRGARMCSPMRGAEVA